MVNVLFYDAFYNKGGMTQEEICQRTFQSKQTVNLIVKNLLAENYVTVAEAPEHKWNKIVRMTDAGRACCEPVVRHITWAEDTAMSLFTPEEQTHWNHNRSWSYIVLKCTGTRCPDSIRCAKTRRMWSSPYSGARNGTANPYPS